MKKYRCVIAVFVSKLAVRQSSVAITNATADAIMASNYSPDTYNSGINASPGCF